MNHWRNLQRMSASSPLEPLALVFTDIEDSSRLWEEHGERFMEAVEAHNALLREVCAAQGGSVIKEEGDAFFLVFSDPVCAATFAVQGQEALAAYEWESHGFPALRVRMGLHFGETIARAGDHFGPEVNRTARICSAGHGGQVLASDEFISASGEPGAEVVLTDLARHRLRGLSEPQHLYQITLAHWPQQEWPLLRTLDDVPTNLPAQVTSFVGRERDLERVASLLTDPQVRLLTLTGPGGSGKSRLAQEAAARSLESFPDGVFWISLAEFSTVEAVPAAILEVLKLKPEAGRSPAAVIAAHARDRQQLLVLDNFEHLIEAADFVAELLSLSRDIRLLVTSREVLHLQGEQLFHVLPLALPEPPINYQTLSQYESVHLFLQRARAVSEDFTITEDNAAAIAEICLRLDGIPLALELAAAWVGVYPPLRILQRLGGRSQVLTSRVRGVAERQRTVADTIDWSYRMLSAEEQRTLRWLSVFRGGLFLEAAEAVCGPTASENVMTLYDKSLLYAREALGQQRFHLLETIREFAEERLVEAGEEHEARRGHWTYYARWVEDCQRVPQYGAQESYWFLVALEAANVEEAVRQATRQGCMAEVVSLLYILFDRLGASPGVAERLLLVLNEVLAQALGHEGEVWPAVASWVRLACYHHSGRYGEGLGRAEEAFALAEASGDDERRYGCASWASILAIGDGKRQDAIRWARQMGNWVEDAQGRSELAGHLSNIGDLQQALAQADRALADGEGMADLYGRCFTLANSLGVYMEAGQFERGLPFVPELVGLVRGPLREVPSVIQFAWVCAVPITARCGDREEAARLAREQAALQDTLEPDLRAVRLVVSLTYCIWGGLWQVAAELADQYLGPWPIADLPVPSVVACGGTMAEVNSRRGDREQALAAITPLLQSECGFDEEGDYFGGQRLKSSGEVLRVCGKLAEAVQVTVVAARLQSLWPFRKLFCEELLELLASEMPAEAFAQAKSEGETMTGVEAFALARKTLGL